MSTNSSGRQVLQRTPSSGIVGLACSVEAVRGSDMIGKLRGSVECVEDDHCVMDVNGVGYVAYCSSSTLAGLSSDGGETALFIETVVREDMIRLYGFRTEIEREWFRVLQNNVQGVGAKVALSVLSTLTLEELARAVVTKDTDAVARTPGVGKKVAERIVAELQNKLPAGAGLSASVAQMPTSRAADEALSALVNLGYGRGQATAAIAAAMRDAGEGAEAATLIRIGLKAAAR